MLSFWSGASEPSSRKRQPVLTSFFAVAAFIIGLSALVHSVNHDESQYVAAIALMRQGLPYRDFAYLQTPLQPLLLSPLAYLPSGWVLIGARAANALFGVATTFLILIALRRRVSACGSSIALAALLSTGPFLLACSLARNDALAMVLLAAALPPLLSATETRSLSMFGIAGLALGLATSAKINAALPGAGAGLFLLLRSRRYGLFALLTFAGGVLLGLLPILLMASLAPRAFWFDVFTYNLEAPNQWWTAISQGIELDPLRRALKLLGFACLGSVLVALFAIPFDRSRTETRRILDFMVVGGVVAAFLPVPALIQYLVPLLPPLFVRFGFALDGMKGLPRRSLIGLAGLGAIAGLGSSFVVHFSQFEAIRAISSGSAVAALARGGNVATLSPEYVAGGGIFLDRRFAAGPFLYRTHGELARSAEVQGKAITAASVESAFASEPPAVIVMGAERTPFPPQFPQGLDQALATWAKLHEYRRIELSDNLAAFVRPRYSVPARPRTGAW